MNDDEAIKYLAGFGTIPNVVKKGYVTTNDFLEAICRKILKLEAKLDELKPTSV